jgi:hypothetical protein
MNSTELINALKIKGSFPTSDDLFSNDDFLVLFNMQMQVEILPIMLKLNEEYFLQTKDFTISQGSSYRIPSRAIGTNIRDLKKIDASGNYSDINRLYEEDRSSAKSGFYMVRNSVELSQDFNSGTLRMTYFARPNKIVLPISCAQISSINTGANTVVVSSAPATMSTGVLIDFIQNNNPFDLLDFDEPLTSVSGTTLGFASLPSGLSVGDWVCISNESPVPLVPEELHPVLVQSALVTTLSSKKDKALDYESKKLVTQIEAVLTMLDPRVQNNSTKMRSGKMLDYFASRRV